MYGTYWVMVYYWYPSCSGIFFSSVSHRCVVVVGCCCSSSWSVGGGDRGGVIFNKYCGVGDAGPFSHAFFKGGGAQQLELQPHWLRVTRSCHSTTTCMLLIGQMKFGGKKSLWVPIVNHNRKPFDIRQNKREENKLLL